MSQLIIFGAGDIARLAHYYFTRDSEHEVVAFTVDQKYREADTFLDLPLVSFEDVTHSYPPGEYKMFVALSYARMNKLREEKYRAAKEKNYELVSYVSSRCSFLTDHPVGDNCFILEDNTIQPFVTIGNNVVLWSGNHIGHHSQIKDHNFFTSHVVLSGHCVVNPYCFLGVNATIRDQIQLAEGTLVGMSAIIMRNTEPWSVYKADGSRAAKISSKDLDF